MALWITDNSVTIGANGTVLTADSTKIHGVAFAALPAVGILQSQEFTSTGTWTQPSGVTAVWITMIGGGGGGSATIAAATGGGGGGSGEFVENMLVPVSGNVTVTIGAKGTGAATGQGSAQVGVAGGDTSFGSTYIAKGGGGAPASASSGAGGGLNGATSRGPAVAGILGTVEAPLYYGGSAGGGGGNTTAIPGAPGAGAGGYPTGGAGGAVASTQAGGGGGANTIWGVGGAGGAGGGAGNSAASTSYGAGGGGGGGHATTTVAGGDGCKGYCLVVWVA